MSRRPGTGCSGSCDALAGYLMGELGEPLVAAAG